MVALQRAPLRLVIGQSAQRLRELVRRHPEFSCRLVEAGSRLLVERRVRAQRQVVRKIRPGAGESVPLGGLRNRVVKGGGIFERTRVGGGRARSQACFRLQDGPCKGSGIGAIDDDRVKAVQAQMIGEPGDAPILFHRAALLDAAAVEDHDRHRQPRVLRPPPARSPVRTPLLLERTVAQESDERFARHRHVHVLKLGETEISAFDETSGRVRIDMTAERRARFAVGVDRVRVKIGAQAGKARIGDVVAR